MTDIVKRLRSASWNGRLGLVIEAADEIERLRMGRQGDCSQYAAQRNEKEMTTLCKNCGCLDCKWKDRCGWRRIDFPEWVSDPVTPENTEKAKRLRAERTTSERGIRNIDKSDKRGGASD